MALSKQQKQQKEELHQELREYLKRHRIPKKVAAEYFDEDYNIFVTCLKRGVFSNEKIATMVERKKGLKEFTNRLYLGEPG